MNSPVKLLSVGALTLDTILRVDTLPTRQGKFIASDGVQIASGMASSAACAARRPARQFRCGRARGTT
jgi:sulfofructose kinase